MAPRAAGPESQARILVVDDDEDLRVLLAMALRDDAHRVDQAGSAVEARQRLARSRYDLVVTDLSMPGEDGLALMRWAQERETGAHWIVLTGYGTFDAAVEALQIGASDFLSKPLQGVGPLRSAVRKVLADRRNAVARERRHAQVRENNAHLREHVEQLERACHLLREQADSIRGDLIRAGLIQRALLPRTAPELDGYQVQALYRPSHNVGGDLYDVVRLDDHRAVLFIADAAGHGLSAAMLALLFRSLLPVDDVDESRGPGALLESANRALCETLPGRGLFLTAACCLLDTRRGSACISSAGHPPVLLQRSRGAMERIFHTGPALGLRPDATFAEHSVEIEPGDRLLFYSDGLFQRFLGDSAAPGEALATALARHTREGREGSEVLKRLASSDRPGEPGGGLQEDDITLLLLTATAGDSVLDNGSLRPLASLPSPPREVQILRGETDDRLALCVQGRGDWTRSASFHAECAGAIGAGRGVLVDLALCRQLDSTFLGTIHLVCEQAEQADVELRLQGVLPGVEELFVELGMSGVMDHIVPCMLPLPTGMHSLAPAEGDPSSEQFLVLRAHEALASLNERNRRDFDPLLTLLRKEVRPSGPP